MPDDFYDRFHRMEVELFGDPESEAGLAARAFYEAIVGDEAIVRLTRALRLKVTEGGQDWAIEVEDADRLVEFLEVFEHGSLDGEERYWLLELIIASLDTWLSIHDDDEAMTNRVRGLLLANFDRHAASIRYWAADGDDDTRFEVTRLMRDVLAEKGAPPTSRSSSSPAS